VDPREKVLGFYKPELKQPADKMSVSVETDDFSIRSYGKFAVVITRLTFTRAGEGKPLPPIMMRATIVCRREKGVWKIASAQYTGIRPSPTAPPAE
ncbi:MAG: nuclear transport factor 2 family protein, partial [Acidobacteriota bacterium]|nr:nuclear transport factor 2 family protein [Acidobacteriota bacterium]